MGVKYCVQRSDQRFFVRETGDRTWEFKPERKYAMLMDLATAKRFVEILGMKNVIGRVCDQYGNPQSDYAYAVPAQQQFTLHNSHENFVYRNRGVEIPVTHNKVLGKFYFKFSMNPDPNAPFDQSLSADTPEALIDRFVDNPHLQKVVERYRVDETLPTPVAADTAPAGPVVQVALRPGEQLVSVGYRPGSVRRE